MGEWTTDRRFCEEKQEECFAQPTITGMHRVQNELREHPEARDTTHLTSPNDVPFSVDLLSRLACQKKIFQREL
jgi:hypothetical protein